MLNFLIFSKVSGGIRCEELFLHNSFFLQLIIALIQSLAENALNFGFFYCHYWSFGRNEDFVQEREVSM